MIDQFLARWKEGSFDFLDFGCSDGGNIRFVEKHWPHLHGLGIDVDPGKIERAVANGHDAIVFNIDDLPGIKFCRFVTMSHFLEHLNSVSDARRIVRKAIEIAERFIVIRQPWFDADGLLLEHGLKFYWSHWTGHPNRMSSLDFYAMLMPELSAGTIRGFEMFGRDLVKTTQDSSVIPLHAPSDQHHYDPSRHGQKPPEIQLPIAVFREIVVVIETGQDPVRREMLDKLGKLRCLYSWVAH